MTISAPVAPRPWGIARLVLVRSGQFVALVWDRGVPDDPRVKAAVKWIGMHYDLASNPGMGEVGLYYYYHTFAKALDAMQSDTFVDQQGVKHSQICIVANRVFSLEPRPASPAAPEETPW